METDTLVVDTSVLDSYRILQEDGEPDVVTELIDVFLEDLPTRLASIRQSIGNADAKQIRSAAHALKGAAASIGAARLAARCSALEAVGRGGTTIGADQFVAPIEATAAEAVAALRALRQ